MALSRVSDNGSKKYEQLGRPWKGRTTFLDNNNPDEKHRCPNTMHQRLRDRPNSDVCGRQKRKDHSQTSHAEVPRAQPLSE
eukprot:3221556-Amphidinium_carterae.1